MMGGIIGGAKPSIVFNGYGYNSGNTDTPSVVNVPLGVEHPRRTIILLVGGGGLSLPDMGEVTENVTLDGNPATILHSSVTPSGISRGQAFAVIDQPSGTTGTVAWNSSLGSPYFFGGVACWSAYNLRVRDAVVGSGEEFADVADLTLGGNITVSNGGIAALWSEAGPGDPHPFTWDGVTDSDSRATWGSGTGSGDDHTVAHIQDAAAPTMAVEVTRVDTGAGFFFFWISMR